MTVPNYNLPLLTEENHEEQKRAMSETAISLSQVGMKYINAGEEERTVLDNVSLEIKKGEFVAFYSSVFTFQDGGADFINVFQTFKNSPQYLVAKKESGIKSGEIDAASAMSYNEYLLLLDEYDESDLNVIDMNKEGVAMLEDCLFTDRKWAEEHRDTLVRFLRATIKGWQYAAENPEEAGKIVFAIGNSATEKHQIAMTKKVIETAVIPEGSTADEIGKLDTDRIQRTIDQGFSTGLISQKIDINDSIDPSYWEEAVAGLK